MVSRREFGLTVLATSVCLGAQLSPYRLVVVSGGSMQPTYHNHQVLVMERERRPLESVRRGDVVVFQHGDEVLIKRVRAIGGDRIALVEFKSGFTIVLGDLGYARQSIVRFARTHPGAVRIARQTVPPGAIYVVGDNVNSSIDSRDFGAVPAEEVLGRVVTADRPPAGMPAPHLVASLAAQGI